MLKELPTEEDKFKSLEKELNFLSSFSSGTSFNGKVQWKDKFILMNQIRKNFQTPPGLRVTNLTNSMNGKFNNVDFSFNYQRQVTNIKIPFIYLKNFSAPPHDEDRMLTSIFTKSGQSAMSLLIYSLKDHFNDFAVETSALYFETKNICENLKLKINRNVVDKKKIVIWDATTEWSELTDVSNLLALVIDTTYLHYDEIPIEKIKSIINDIPVFFVRSHVKLDSLGAEYGLLGSLWISSPARFFSSTQLHDKIFSLARLWGIYANVEEIYPFMTSENYYEINSERIMRLKNIGKFWSQNIQHPKVRHYPHNLFFTIDLPKKLSAANFTSFQGLVKAFKIQGLECLNVDSFGFDFIAYKLFDIEEEDHHILRITSANLTQDEAQIIAHGVNSWMEKLS